MVGTIGIRPAIIFYGKSLAHLPQYLEAEQLRLRNDLHQTHGGRGVSKIILDLCGGTGSWSRPYREAGYEVHLVTLPDDVRKYEPPRGKKRRK